MDVDFRFTAGEFQPEFGRAQEFVERIRQFLVTDRANHPKHGNV